MSGRKLGKIAVQSSAFFLCDMQEGFRKTISYYPAVIEVARRVLAASEHLNMPVVVTEQYPKGLGPTVSELNVKHHKVFPKTKFTMAIPEVEEHLSKYPDIKSILLCGIEGHVCIQLTALDLLERGYDVHVIVDGISSRSMVDRMFALQRMKEAGAFLTTSESALLSLVADAKHPQFKGVQKVIWDSAPDSGLLGPGTPV
ncbi:isochorismatase domain-containing protein 2-like [Lingula anatina]|uniref:Isochorismatase domain-containing protein 2 n=1 Tax=Lingula anatina TaxID=7574 RepID=A0A1S3IH87_LINAN|nr:isochorismatase domain-containing protein 2 [Lingula anatina]XP_013397236.1 isochorismatase domain-containing protein 2-like [Lingula anatina]|eukprot:XP_013379034.1 isochorismatase domain-containing protein 2 [Lingula anatina]